MRYQVTKVITVEASTEEEAKQKAEQQLEQATVRVSSSIRSEVQLPAFGVGNELRNLISKFKLLQPARNCNCAKHIYEMNLNGVEWCKQNIDTIVGWLKEEADRAHLPFVELGAKILVRRAIKNTEKLIFRFRPNQPRHRFLHAGKPHHPK